MSENGLSLFMSQDYNTASLLTRFLYALCSPVMESKRDQIRKEILLEAMKNKQKALTEIMDTIHDGIVKKSLTAEQFDALYALYYRVLLSTP